MTKLKPTRWATREEIEAAEQAFPRDRPDEENVRKIMAQAGLSRHTAKLALAIMRGSEGDEIVVDAVAEVLGHPYRK